MSSRGPKTMADVEIRTFKDVDLRGGTVVAAFPSVGLVSTITTTYMISTMQMDQVCALESEDYPSLSMIYAKKPKFPARVYALRDLKLALFICEVPLPTRAHPPTALALPHGAHAHGPSAGGPAWGEGLR